MAFQSVALQLGPILFQVVSQAQQKLFQIKIRSSPHEEALKLAVALQNTKSTFHLNGTIHA